MLKHFRWALLALVFVVGVGAAVASTGSTLPDPLEADLAALQDDLDQAQSHLAKLRSDMESTASSTTTADTADPASTTTTTAPTATETAPTATTATPSTATDTVDLTDKSWECEGPVDLKSVKVTITPNAQSSDGVYLREGCTGYIGRIDVVNYKGDGIKVNSAHDLVVGGGSVRCYAHSDGKHQDGVQVQGGTNVVLHDLDVGCYSANNAQVWINDGHGDKPAPDHVVFDGGRFQGYYDGGSYGPGGSYGVAILGSTASGFRNATICPNAHPEREFKIGDSAVDPVNENNVVADSC